MAQQQMPQAKQEAIPNWIQVVRSQVESIRFGIVQITVHDSRVVHVERVEKVRFNLLDGDTGSVAVKEPSDGN